MQKVNLSFNKMKKLEIFPEKEMPTGFPISNIAYFKKLTHLNLSFNTINPLSLTQLSFISQTLESLDLTGNHLKFIPAVFAQLSSLSKLNLSNNKLSNSKSKPISEEMVFTSLGYVPKLKNLDLSHNKLEFIPDDEECELVHEMFRNLTELDLSHNKIS